MDILARAFVFIFTGLILLIANIWFVRTIHRHFLSTEYVVAPFNVLDASGKIATEQAGEALARMMTARLRNIQTQLGATAAPTAVSSPAAAELDVRVLFVPEGVDVPTGLFEPIDIKATVGGVDVGGVFSWLQGILVKEKVIRFTTYEKAGTAVVSADVQHFAPGLGDIWFESAKDSDEIATNAAYALIQLKLAERGSTRINRLHLDDFRALLETVFQVTEYNQRAVSGYIVSSDFSALLPGIEKQLEEVPDWPELIYLTGRIAEAAGNLGRAILHYRRLQTLGTDVSRGVDERMLADVARRLTGMGQADQLFADERQQRFTKSAADFGRLMRLKGPDPEIAFVPQEMDAIQAVWSSEHHRMEVNPTHLETPGLPQYVAMMGRFFARNYDQCFDGIKPKPGSDVDFWTEFRHSVVGYLIQSQPEFQNVTNVGVQYGFYKFLEAIEAGSGADPTKRLALELLDQYACDWSRERIAGQVVRINKERGFIPESVIVDAAAAIAFPLTPQTLPRRRSGTKRP